MLRPLCNARGVTLVELMVVVAIIAIVAAIAVAVFQDLTQKAKLAADQDTVGSLRSAVALYYGKTNGLIPTTMASINTLLTPAPTFQCTVNPTYDSTNGKVTHTATLNDCP
jgi:type IV pilus assembly protein PilA